MNEKATNTLTLHRFEHLDSIHNHNDLW